MKKSLWVGTTRILLVALCLVGFAMGALAQDATGRIVGTITDPSGAVVPGAKITAVNVATSLRHDTLSGPNGAFQILALPAGLTK